MKKIIKKYPVILTLTIICLMFAILTTFNEGMYDLFAFHSKPVYFWQIFSGTFMHGLKGQGILLLWIHFILNFLTLIIPFGCLLEKKIGSKKMFIVLIIAIIISSIVFQILLYGKDEMATGISAVGYAFFAGGIIIVIKSWKKLSKAKRFIYVLLTIMAIICLMPTTLGIVTSLMHLSGIVSYFIATLIIKKIQ